MKFATFFVSALAACLLAHGAARAGQSDGRLDIYWIDVEGGAATLVVTPRGESLLVDTGYPGHRDADRIPAGDRALVAQAVGDSPALTKLVAMREELRQLWTRTNVSAEQLVADLQAWCRRAEDSGIAALQEFSLKLRAARA